MLAMQSSQFSWSVLVQDDTVRAISRPAISTGVTAHDVLCSTVRCAIREVDDEAMNIRLAVRVKYSSHRLPPTSRTKRRMNQQF